MREAIFIGYTDPHGMEFKFRLIHFLANQKLAIKIEDEGDTLILPEVDNIKEIIELLRAWEEDAIRQRENNPHYRLELYLETMSNPAIE
ncbi:MAG: hypothetical protein WAQ41_03165 [bacterium]|jgi:hypothetical protein|nr:hypothetical protein [Bacillota bacterium]HHW55966.1 hypothetical protein [Bacillota bacterium]